MELGDRITLDDFTEQPLRSINIFQTKKRGSDKQTSLFNFNNSSTLKETYASSSSITFAAFDFFQAVNPSQINTANNKKFEI